MSNEQLKQSAGAAKKGKAKDRQQEERRKWKTPDLKRKGNTRIRRISGRR